jgi:myo-inositol-1(or 4)-monophosphatase
MLPHLDDLAILVKAVAEEELLPRFSGTERRFKPDGSVVTEADFAVQKRLTIELRERYPEFELLGEEMDAQRQQELLAQNDNGLWCLDPLDGTSNFAAGLPFSVFRWLCSSSANRSWGSSTILSAMNASPRSAIMAPG